MSWNREGGWQPRPQGRPVWTTKAELFHVLGIYKQWYEMGLSDTEISARIRAKFILPSNPQVAFRDKKSARR